jgi:hypothetical protein
MQAHDARPDPPPLCAPRRACWDALPRPAGNCAGGDGTTPPPAVLGPRAFSVGPLEGMVPWALSIVAGRERCFSLSTEAAVASGGRFNLFRVRGPAGDGGAAPGALPRTLSLPEALSPAPSQSLLLSSNFCLAAASKLASRTRGCMPRPALAGFVVVLPSSSPPFSRSPLPLPSFPLSCESQSSPPSRLRLAEAAEEVHRTLRLPELNRGRNRASHSATASYSSRSIPPPPPPPPPLPPACVSPLPRADASLPPSRRRSAHVPASTDVGALALLPPNTFGIA